MNNNQLYRVELLFDAQDPILLENVVAHLSKLDPTAAQRLGRLSRGHIIVKKNVPLTKARRLARALQIPGADCRINRQAMAPTHPTAVAASRLRCPKCDTEQPIAHECRTCGVVIEKARRRALQPPPAPPEPLPEKPSHVTSLRAVWQRIAVPLVIWIRKRPAIPGQVQNWSKRFGDRLLSCGVLFAVALVLEILLLHLLELLWFVYTSTGVGKYYLEHFPEKADVFRHLLAVDLSLLAWDCTLTVLYISLAVSAAAQLLHLVRLLFDYQGLAVKLAVWCAPVAALAAWRLTQLYDGLLIFPAVFLVLIPTLGLLSSCMLMARDAIPEMGALWGLLTQASDDGQGPLTRFRQKLGAWIDAHLS